MAGTAATLVAAALVVAAPWDGAKPAPTASPRTTTTSATAPEPTAPPTTTTSIPPVFLPERTGGVRLLLARRGEVDLVDLDANSLSTHEVEGLSVHAEEGNFSLPPVVVRRRDQLVFQGGDATFAVPLDFSREPRALGPSELFLASAAEDRVWLVSLANDGVPSIREVDLDGRVVTAPVPLPPDWTPRAALDGGILLVRNDRFQVWDPTTGRARVSSEPGVTVVAAGGRRVAWRFYCERPFCPLHFTDALTGQDRAVYEGGGLAGPPNGTFSPDGRTLAVFAQQREGEVGRSAVAFVDVDTGTTTFSRSQTDFGELVWSASGRWVFSVAIGGPSSTLTAYRADLPVGLQVDLGRRSGGFTLLAW